MIQSHEEHQEALAKLIAMIEADPDSGTPQANELIDLARDIEDYEDVHYPLTLSVVKTVAGMEKTG